MLIQPLIWKNAVKDNNSPGFEMQGSRNKVKAMYLVALPITLRVKLTARYIKVRAHVAPAQSTSLSTLEAQTGRLTFFVATT
jgi:hypothetical protein